MEMVKKSQEEDIMSNETNGLFRSSSEHSLEKNNDLSHWEFVNPSDADSDDVIIDNLSLKSFQDGLLVSRRSPLSSSRSSPEDNQTKKPQLVVIDQDRFVGCFDKPVLYNDDEEDDDDEGYKYYVGLNYGDYYDDGGDDLDDEHVPWYVSGKLGRQRMRTMGKRPLAKMQYSKKSPSLYMKPGCVQGKHGLGKKRSF